MPARTPARTSRPLITLAALGVAALTAGCGGGDSSGGGEPAPSGGSASASGDGPLQVVASTDVWGDVARTVGGDAVEVTSIVDDPSQDPHSYEASARDRLAVSDAALVISNGGGYDEFMERLVEASGEGTTVIDAVDVSGYTAEEGEELNEHVWYDMPTVTKVADRIAAALGEADPEGAETFSANADALGEDLEGVESAQASVAEVAQGTAIAITEPVPLYLTQACGLTNATPEEFSEAVEEGTDVPPAVLADTEALFTDGTVSTLVYNEQTTGPETDAVLAAAQDSGATVVPVTETLPEGEDFVGWMLDNVRAVRTAVAP